MTKTQTQHLQRLAFPQDVEPRQNMESADLAQLLRGYTTPAVAYDHTWKVLSYNAAFREALPSAADTPNLLMWYFTNAEAQRLFVDWETEAAELIARLRTIQSHYRELGAFDTLTHQLSQASQVAAKLWAAGIEVTDEPARKLYKIRRSEGHTTYCKVIQLQPTGRSDSSLRIAVCPADNESLGYAR